MLYLIWAVINIIAYVYFIYVLIISGKLVRQKLGLLAACVFVLGLFSFVGVTHDEDSNIEPGTNRYKSWKLYTGNDTEKDMNMWNDITIGSNMISKYTLSYTHGRIKGSTMRVPIEASSAMAGTEIGTRWQTVSINMEPADNFKGFKYIVHGTVNWYLMGIKIYSQAKTYTGIAPAINRL